MVIIFVFLIVSLSVFVIAFPLFFIKLQKYRIKSSMTSDKTNFWLSALSDLDDDFDLGRISQVDYKKQQLTLKRNYLESIKK